jgi:hypothetical protein
VSNTRRISKHAIRASDSADRGVNPETVNIEARARWVESFVWVSPVLSWTVEGPAPTLEDCR